MGKGNERVSFLSFGPALPPAQTLSPFAQGDHKCAQPVASLPPSFLSSQFPKLLQSWKPQWWVPPQGRWRGGLGGGQATW